MVYYNSELVKLTNEMSNINEVNAVSDLKTLKEKLKKLKLKVTSLEKQCTNNKEDEQISKRPRLGE